MFTRLRSFTALLAVLSALGAEACATASTQVGVAIRTRENTVALQRDPAITLFNVTAVVSNKDTRPLYVGVCGTSAQRDIDGTWTTVFIPYCFASGALTVAPGDSAVVPVKVYGFTTPNTLPRLDPRMRGGRYRLLFGIGFQDPVTSPTSASSLRAVASSPFTVRE